MTEKGTGERSSRKHGPIQREASSRVHVFWSGRVQGVGFRYTAESVALELGLAGWVMNLPDGRVEALCEGPEKALKAFLERIAAGPMRGYIRGAETHWEQATGDLDGFRIRFF